MTSSDRRSFLRMLGLLGVGAVLPARAHAAAPRVGALFCGRIDDGGFMQAGYRGLVGARDRLGCEIFWKDGVAPKLPDQLAALRALAGDAPDLIVAHGGQNNEATRTVAAEFPKIRFVVTQGGVRGANLASYVVLQEQSAFLAGALAARLTRTGVVGHISGIRVPPGLRGRAAFAAGVAHADPKVRLLTNFCGDQDDVARAHAVAAAEAKAGADVIFTMLNAGRGGAIDACREAGIRQIGNVVDWVARQPDVFVASAIADSGLAVFDAARDVAADRFAPGATHEIGLEDVDAVRLVVAASVDAEIGRLTEAVKTRAVVVPTDWQGEEFVVPGAP